MPTRAELRNVLRHRLEDLTTAPLWDDAALNDALAAAVRTYGARFPRDATAVVEVTAGVSRIAVSVEIDPTTIARVIDSTGQTVPRLSPDAGSIRGQERQAWRWWDGALILARAATGGTWQIEYLAARAIPGDETTPIDLFPGDEEIVLTFATAVSLRRRQGEDAKRGLRADGIAQLAMAAESAATRLMAARRQRARGGWLVRE